MTPRYRMMNCRHRVATLCLLSLLAVLLIAPVSTSFAGKGSFHNRDLTLHVFLDWDATPAELGPSGKIQKYYNEAAKAFYDSTEGQGKIVKIYLYNNLPEGKAKADIQMLDLKNPDGTPRSGAYARGSLKNGSSLGLG